MTGSNSGESLSQSHRVIAGRYELGRTIGRGAMSEIYEARDIITGDKVAIKILNEKLSAHKKLVDLFTQEASSATSLNHPHIISVLDSGQDTPTDPSDAHPVPFIVMEYVDGLELSKVIERGPLKISEAIRVTQELLSAIQHAHSAGIIHRDIKPANIMITRNGEVKVVDFGIARAISESFDDLDQTTSILGTAAYFSPEQAQGEKVDVRTDIYAIGIVLYEMLTGKPPFEGDTAVAVAHQHIHAQPEPPSSLNPKVSPALDAVVMKALEKKKNLRFQKTETFATALENAAKDKPKIVTPAPVEDEISGTISEPAVAATSAAALPDDFTYLFGSDPSTAPTLIQPEEHKPERKRVLSLVAIIALVSMVLTGVGVWVATLEPINLFPPSTITMPDMTGQTSATAKQQLTDLGLFPEIVEQNSGTVAKNRVIRTDPPEGTVVDPGTPVKVFVSQGKTRTPVPDVSDMTVEEATTVIEEEGFVVGTVTETTSANIAAGNVISTTPAVGTTVLQGSKVNLTVSNGKITIPELRGKSVSEASTLLSDVQIYPTIEADPNCPKSATPTVRSQSVSPGDVPQNTSITLTYCSG